MDEASVRQRLIAILCADAAGFSRLMAGDEHATLAALDAARELFRGRIESNHGRVIDMAGDSILAVFETATGAVSAAIAIQQDLAQAENAGAPPRRLPFRIGVHLGDVIEKQDGTVYGDGVNVAARLQALAEPGGIVVSDAVRGAVGSRVDARFADRGEQPLKNIARPIHAFAVHPGRARTRRRPLRRPVPAHARPGCSWAAAAELAQLQSALQGARKGCGQVVLLAGSGGMGKTV